MSFLTEKASESGDVPLLFTLYAGHTRISRGSVQCASDYNSDLMLCLQAIEMSGDQKKRRSWVASLPACLDSIQRPIAECEHAGSDATPWRAHHLFKADANCIRRLPIHRQHDVNLTAPSEAVWQ